MARLLITGGSGFIGRNLVEHFRPDHTVLAPSHAELDLTSADGTRAFFQENAVDAVIHCATKPGHRNAPDPTGLVYNNTRMFFNLVRNRRCFGKMVYLSTGAVYDVRHFQPKMPEGYFDAYVPVDETGYSKYVCARFTADTDDIIELRPFGVFGKYEDYAIRFISNAICKTLFDLPITLKQNRRFDYIYIDDLARVVDYFLHHDATHSAYNVTPDGAIELRTLAEKVLSVSGKELPVIVAQPGMGIEYSGDNSRLRTELDGLVLTPIDEAVRRLYDWYSANIDLIDREALLIDK